MIFEYNPVGGTWCRGCGLEFSFDTFAWFGSLISCGCKGKTASCCGIANLSTIGCCIFGCWTTGCTIFEYNPVGGTWCRGCGIGSSLQVSSFRPRFAKRALARAETWFLSKSNSLFCFSTVPRSRSCWFTNMSIAARLSIAAPAHCFRFFGRHASHVALPTRTCIRRRSYSAGDLPLNSVIGFHRVQLLHFRRSGELSMFKIFPHAERSFGKNRMLNPFRQVRSAFSRGLLLSAQILHLGWDSFCNLTEQEDQSEEHYRVRNTTEKVSVRMNAEGARQR